MGNFADDVAVRWSKGKPADSEKKESADDADAPADAPKPGARGKMLIAAIGKKDGEAVEEIVKAICS